VRAAIRHANTFSTSRFGGNPTPVFMLPRWPSDATLLALTRETGLGYAAFVVSGDVDALRWFHPVGESMLCGHATLAAGAMVLDGRPGHDRVAFHTAAGIIPVWREGAHMTLELATARAHAADPPEALLAALGRRPREAWRSDRWMLVYGEEGDVAGIAPDFAALAQAEPGEVVVTAAAAPGSDADFVYRCFEPALGVDEDPVTGSAQCTLGPYWAERVGRTRLRSRQLSARGGEIACVVGAERVTISGAVSTYLEGVIEVGAD
jgi:PhzF family phenazine biosynthesis protein